MAFSSDAPLVSNQLPISFEIPKDPKNLVEVLELLYKRIADAVNRKEGSLYQRQEVATFQQYYPFSVTDGTFRFRPIYRRTVDFGMLPNAGTKSVAHGIAFTSQFTTTRIYGSATDPTNLTYIPLPYASPTLANNIELNVDGTNVNVITGVNRENFTRCSIVIEYSKFL
jgi:hypothetical protein